MVVPGRTGVTASRSVGELAVNTSSFEHLDTVHGSSHAPVTSPPFAVVPGDRTTVAFDPARAALYDEDGALVDKAAERTAVTVRS
jgi:hypothetical protein